MSKAIKDTLDAANRIVIKIGSSLLVDAANHEPKKAWMAALAGDIANLRNAGKQVIIVSSGAIALGAGVMGLTGRPNRLEDAQAAAAVGQFRLASAYETIFSRHDIPVAQLLLSIGDMEDRPRYLNARNTVEALLGREIMPIVNENDTVATSEIRFGDNDRLAARVGQLVQADVVILLSDIDGLYDGDPRTSFDASLIEEVDTVTDAIREMAGPSDQKGPGTGGMVTKIQAAEIATDGGSKVVICNGVDNNPISRLTETGTGTLFRSKSRPLDQRKQWIRGMMAPTGFIQLDAGAEQAIRKGASLLAAGVIRVDGDFRRGDLVAILDVGGHAFAQGLSSYESSEASKIKGFKMSDVIDILGYSGRSALIHRDDLVILHD